MKLRILLHIFDYLSYIKMQLRSCFMAFSFKLKFSSATQRALQGGISLVNTLILVASVGGKALDAVAVQAICKHFSDKTEDSYFVLVLFELRHRELC